MPEKSKFLEITANADAPEDGSSKIAAYFRRKMEIVFSLIPEEQKEDSRPEDIIESVQNLINAVFGEQDEQEQFIRVKEIEDAVYMLRQRERMFGENLAGIRNGIQQINSEARQLQEESVFVGIILQIKKLSRTIRYHPDMAELIAKSAELPESMDELGTLLKKIRDDSELDEENHWRFTVLIQSLESLKKSPRVYPVERIRRSLYEMKAMIPQLIGIANNVNILQLFPEISKQIRQVNDNLPKAQSRDDAHEILKGLIPINEAIRVVNSSRHLLGDVTYLSFQRIFNDILDMAKFRNREGLDRIAGQMMNKMSSLVACFDLEIEKICDLSENPKGFQDQLWKIEEMVKEVKDREDFDSEMFTREEIDNTCSELLRLATMAHAILAVRLDPTLQFSEK